MSPALGAQVYVVRPPFATPTGRYLGTAHFQRLLREPPSALRGTWRGICGVTEDGCVLVRPDLIVGWRCHELPGNPAQVLGDVMDSILGYAA